QRALHGLTVADRRRLSRRLAGLRPARLLRQHGFTNEHQYGNNDRRRALGPDLSRTEPPL
ncbi:MAG: hypothetical protein WA693_02375, partial [Pseudolabrys sp.]